MTLVCGVDEAGRGPVIGPMVMVGLVINEKDEQKLKDIGVKDSKLLSHKQRVELISKVKSIAKDLVVLVVQPEEIDSALLSPDTNLNWLEADKAIEIINNLRPDKVILDCPSNNPKAYIAYVKNKLKVECKIVAEHKADVNYPVVSAASIVAKVTREDAIDKLKEEIGINFGSGYPADPVTQDFMKKNWNKYSKVFRKTWASYKAIAIPAAQKGLDEF